MDYQFRGLLDIQPMEGRNGCTITRLVNRKHFNWALIDSTVYGFCLASFIKMFVTSSCQTSYNDMKRYIENGRISCFYTVLGENHLIPDALLNGSVAAFRQFIKNADPSSNIVRIFVRIDY